jgi:peroxiredoxin
MAQALPAELGTRATDFALKDVHGTITKLEDVRGRDGTVVVFICNHCPYVKATTGRLVKDDETLKNEGVSLVAINSNDAVGYPEDSFANMARFALERGFTFPYLHDETQEVARAYGAVCTPDFFGFDRDLILRYRGRLDAAGPSPGRRMRHVNSSKLCAQLSGRGWARMCSIPRSAALSNGSRVELSSVVKLSANHLRRASLAADGVGLPPRLALAPYRPGVVNPGLMARVASPSRKRSGREQRLGRGAGLAGRQKMGRNVRARCGPHYLDPASGAPPCLPQSSWPPDRSS